MLFVHQIRRELRSVSAVDAIAFVGAPEVHFRFAIEIVDYVQLLQVAHARVDSE